MCFKHLDHSRIKVQMDYMTESWWKYQIYKFNTGIQTETLTSELNLNWQTLHEMTCFFLGTKVTPNVWLMTAFCTGSICRSHTHAHRGQGSPACSGLTEQWWQSDDDRVTGLFITVSLRRLQLEHPVTVTVPHTHTHTHTHRHTLTHTSYRVEVWEKSNWRRRLDRKWQEWFHHHWGTSGTYQPRQRPAHCTTPTSWK